MTREEFSEAVEAIKVTMNCSAFTLGNCAECPLNCYDIHCGNIEEVLDVIADVEDWIKKHKQEKTISV